MHAYLIVGNTSGQQGKTAEIAEFDNILKFNVTKIDEVRQLKKLSNTLSEYTIVISGLDKASIEAQNAFLKTLEEPPGNLQFILQTPNLNNILDTIVSRCTVLKLSSETEAQNYQDVESFLEGGLSEKFKRVQGLQSKDAINFAEDLSRYLHKHMYESENKILIAKLLKKTLATHRLLLANTNASLALSSLIIGIHITQKRG